MPSLWGKVGECGKGVRVFIGEYEHNLDGKNRLNVPAKFREIVDASRESKTLYVTRGLDTCLFLYTKAQWDEVTASLKAMSFHGRGGAAVQAHLLRNAREVELDEQGRILIPENLKTEARLHEGGHGGWRRRPHRDMGSRAAGRQ